MGATDAKIPASCTEFRRLSNGTSPRVKNPIILQKKQFKTLLLLDPPGKFIILPGLNWQKPLGPTSNRLRHAKTMPTHAQAEAYAQHCSDILLICFLTGLQKTVFYTSGVHMGAMDAKLPTFYTEFRRLSNGTGPGVKNPIIRQKKSSNFI